MNQAPKKGGYVGQAWLVILLALLYGAALAGVETTLGKRIAANRKRETISVIPGLVCPADMPEQFEVTVESVRVSGTDGTERWVYKVSVIPIPGGDVDASKGFEVTVEEVEITDTEGNQQMVYKAGGTDGTLKGWVLPAGGPGFADRIELLIGLKADLSTITGLYVLDQKETPGLGNLIGQHEFQDRFAGKSADEPLVVVKTDPLAGSNQILAITGATISSESVADIANAAIANLKEPIRATLLGGGGMDSPARPSPNSDQK